MRVRTGPSLNHFGFTTLPRSSRILVTGEEGEWLRFLLPPYRTCWIHSRYVKDVGVAKEEVEVIGQRVRLRATSGTDHQWIGVTRAGDRLRTTGKRDESGEWLQCFAPMEATVYIHKSLVELGEEVEPKQLPILFRGLVPPPRRGAPPGGAELTGGPRGEGGFQI
ncbi:MAG: SH3 domain-containing protein, partial [Planctomycetota bacterium]